MMKHLKTLALFGMLATIGSGCSEKIEPQPLTYTQILTGKEKKTWILASAVIVDEKQKFDIPGNSLLNPCQLDDQFIFYANEEKKMEYANGATKCRTTEPDILITDVWQLTPANATLEIGIPRLFGGSKLPFVIKTLTEHSMVLEYYFGDIDASYQFKFSSVGK